MNKNTTQRKMARKSVLVLDIDETLVHSIPNGTRGDFTVTLNGDPTQYQVHVRPGAKSFLKKMLSLSQFLDVGVWTAATLVYATRILDQLLPEWRTKLSFLKTRTHCTTLPNGSLVKDLRRIRDWSDVLLLDDNPLNCRFNNWYGGTKTVLKIKPYIESNAADRELLRHGKNIHSCILSGKSIYNLSLQK